MARQRKEKSIDKIKLKQPDRSGPSDKTLLELADERNLFAEAERRQNELNGKKVPAARVGKLQKIPKPADEDESSEDSSDDDEDDDEGRLSPKAERILETLLWTVCLSTLHFTLDTLVHNQYSADRITWVPIWTRAIQAFLVFSLLVYTLHPHASNPTLLPGLPSRYQSVLRQFIFFVTSVIGGCYMIHITNSFGYMAVMKQAPPLGCLWVWSVIELELPYAVLSLAADGAFLWLNGYNIK
ncbi:hypothetical protein QBC43DRAFT_362456 [Cladorrhinum sp. PSN259]|nr:hypothetical protein QBC43DRAFT_362456 [Cladorrhinum sp. PSN259]